MCARGGGVRTGADTVDVGCCGVEECRSAVEYLRRGEGDAASYTPSLFVKKKRRVSPEVEAVDTEESSAPPIPIRLPVTELAPTG